MNVFIMEGLGYETSVVPPLFMEVSAPSQKKKMSLPTDYEYDEKNQRSLPQFHKEFKDQLPMLVIVTGGYYGETKYDDFSSDQVIRLHRPCQQLRALGRLSRDANRLRDEFLSIPVDGKYKFSVVKDSKTVGDAQSMEDILLENELPVQVRYASYNIQLNSTLRSINGVNILIIKTYIEDYMQGNCMEESVLSPVSTLLALSPDIYVAAITGYTEKSKEAFQRNIKSMEIFVEQNVKFKEQDGCPDLTMFERGAMTTGTGNAVPPDLLPRDYSHGSDDDSPPPPRPPRTSIKEKDEILEDNNYEQVPIPDNNWIPPQNPKPDKKRLLPPRPHKTRLSTDNDQHYRVIEANESTTLPSASSGVYMSISEVSSAESGHISAKESKDSWSFGSTGSYVSDKSVQNIQDILKSLNLSKYCDVFRKHLIDGNILEDLSEQSLRNGFSFMRVEAVKLMKYVRTGHVPK